jgi:hypothetical protein
VGKTMLAVCLAREAVEAGYRVYYTSAADLAARCHRAALEGRWATAMRFYCGPALLVIDLRRPRDYADTRSAVIADGLLVAGFVTAAPLWLSA